MNKIILALAFTFSAGASAAMTKPLCPGNKKMAKEAILKSANSRFGGPCKLKDLKKNMDWPSEGREGYGALAQCPNTPDRKYSVSIKKDHNVCTIKIVRLSPLSGAQCGLTDTWGGEGDEDQPSGPKWNFDESKQVSLGDLTPAQARALPEITKQQIIASFSGEANDIETAIQFIKEGSEAGEGYYRQFEFNGQKFDALEYYPGGNSYGSIYKHGTVIEVAKNGDGDISCVE